MHGKGKAQGTSGLEGLQKLLGVPADGVYGEQTHSHSIPFKVPKRKVHAGEYVWDGHAQALYRGTALVSVPQSIVKDIFQWWRWMVAREPQIHYNQGRPMGELARHHEPPEVPYYEDCSITFSYCAFLGGARAPDPDYKYTGLGNTGSLLRGGFWIAESDIPKYMKAYYLGVIYGTNRWNTHHISAIESPTSVFSMGNEGAPERWSSIHQGPGKILCVRAYPVV